MDSPLRADIIPVCSASSDDMLAYLSSFHLSSGLTVHLEPFPTNPAPHTAADPRFSHTTCSLRDPVLYFLHFLRRHRIKYHSCLQRITLWARGLHQETSST